MTFAFGVAGGFAGFLIDHPGSIGPAQGEELAERGGGDFEKKGQVLVGHSQPISFEEIQQLLDRCTHMGLHFFLQTVPLPVGRLRAEQAPRALRASNRRQVPLSLRAGCLWGTLRSKDAPGESSILMMPQFHPKYKLSRVGNGNGTF